MLKWPWLLIAVASVVGVLVVACGGVAFTAANLPALFGAFTRTSDLPYGADARQRLDVYAPHGSGDRPVIVFWYGGSFSSGQKARYRFVGAALANAGYVAILPDYRLYPQVKFPAFVADAAAALVWAHAHAREYGGDPQRLYVMGHSAGAWLAAMLAYDSRYLAAAGGQRGWIDGLIGLSGPYALAPDTAQLHAIFAPPYSAADWQPVRFVNAASPPALLLHGQDDHVVAVRHTESLSAALRGAGVAVTTRLYEHRTHADTIAALALLARGRAPVLAQIAAFIGRRSTREPPAADAHDQRAKRSVALTSSWTVPASNAE
jgi:acetyl esterase/lipase